MFSLRSAMIQIEPAATRSTMRMPNASARTLLVLSGPGRDVQEEHQVHAHLGDRKDRQPQRDAGLPRAATVLATQNDIAVRTTARANPIV